MAGGVEVVVKSINKKIVSKQKKRNKKTYQGSRRVKQTRLEPCSRGCGKMGWRPVSRKSLVKEKKTYQDSRRFRRVSSPTVVVIEC